MTLNSSINMWHSNCVLWTEPFYLTSDLVSVCFVTTSNTLIKWNIYCYKVVVLWQSFLVITATIRLVWSECTWVRPWAPSLYKCPWKVSSSSQSPRILNTLYPSHNHWKLLLKVLLKISKNFRIKKYNLRYILPGNTMCTQRSQLDLSRQHN